MKKILSVLLFLVMVLLCSAPAIAGDASAEKFLHFRADGTFRIMMFNDFQDDDTVDEKSLQFLHRVLDEVQPDVVVLVGDQLSDHAIDNPAAVLQAICTPMDARHIPFLFTFGNHDHDHEWQLDAAAQAAVYASFGSCYAATDGCDPGTYNKLVYSSDGTTPLFNIYMMDTNNRDLGTWCGLYPHQVEWYRQKSADLKALHGGTVMPSILFQHIPVKEIYQLLREVPTGTPGAVSYAPSGFTESYLLDESKLISTDNLLGEGPCPEHRSKTTGEYEAWVETGDLVFGAYFGHDHVNDFVGVTDDGIQMGYNAGFGYATYGPGDNRAVKVFDFDENDLSTVKISRVRYCDLTFDETPEQPQEKEKNVFEKFVDAIKRFFESIADFFRNLFN